MALSKTEKALKEQLEKARDAGEADSEDLNQLIELEEGDTVTDEMTQFQENTRALLDAATDKVLESGGSIDDSENEGLKRQIAEQQEKILNLKKKKTGIMFEQPSKEGLNRQINKQVIERTLSRKPFNDESKLVHQMNDELLTGAVLFRALAKRDGRSVSLQRAFAEVGKDDYFQYYNGLTGQNAVAKAMAESAATEGAEWAPTIYSSDLIEKVRLAATLAPLFPTFEMQRNTVTYPIDNTDQEFYYVAESTADNAEVTEASKIPAGTYVTGDKVMTARKGGLRFVLSEELDEDSIVPVIPAITGTIVTKFAEGLDSAIINGDRSTPHMDSNVTTTTDRRTMFVGLRKTAQSYQTSLATWDYDSVMKIPEEMDEYGAAYKDLFWLVGVILRHRLGYLRDSKDNNVMLTHSAYGPGASILTGEVGKMANIPVVLSGQLPENLNAAGVYDGSTTDHGVMLLVYRNGFVLGNRRSLKIKTAEIIDTDQIKVVATMRKAFFHKYTGGIVAQGYDLDLS